jgi:hypothetical protein
VVRLVCVLLVAGCSATAPPPAPRAEPAPVMESSDAGTALWLDDSTMLRVEAPARERRDDAVRIRKLAASALGAEAAPDGRTLFLIRGRGGTLVSGPRQVRIRTGHVIAARFSADSRYLALAQEGDRISVVSVADGKVVARLRDAEEPRWVTGDVLSFRRNCGPMTLRVGETARAAGTAPCGRVVHADPDYRVWYVAEPGRLRDGSIPTYTRLARVELSSGDAEVLVEVAPDRSFSAPRVAPSGNRWCYVDADDALWCALGAEPVQLWPRGVQRPVQFSDSGDQLLFAVAGEEANADLYVVEFDDGVIYRVPHRDRQRWRFLPGGYRLVGHGGHDRILVYDLVDRWWAEIGFGRDEWEGMWTVPGDPRRFIVGHERRANRDLYSVELAP